MFNLTTSNIAPLSPLLRVLIALCWLSLFCTLSLTSHASEYQVQVGDLVRVSLPGEESLDKNFPVDRQGRIHLPEVGTISVANLSEDAMQARVKRHLSTVFQDLLNLKVYVYKRQLLINVLGYVETPGEVILPAGTNIQNALGQAGGMRKGAQLDKIQLRRRLTNAEGASQTESIVFNYKQYLDTGDTSLLPQLRSLDVIFVPASPMTGNVEVEFDPSKIADSGDAASNRDAIKVFGEVNSPGSFTYKQNLTLLDLLMRSGGVTRYAGVEKIRVISNNQPKLFDLKGYLDSGDESLLPTIQAGSTIFVPKQEEEIKTGAKMVYIMGEVAKPGAYEGNDNVTFMDILANAGGPTRYAESRQIRVLKNNGQVVPFDLSAYTEGIGNVVPPVITAGDAIFVPEKTDMNEKSWLKVAPNRAVRVIGEVIRPGRIEWSDEMSFLDLLAHVGGPSARADTSNIEIMTPNEKGTNNVFVFNFDQYMQQGLTDQALPVIKAGATIRVHDLPQDPSDNKAQWVRQSSEKSIYILGQVVAPGRYMFTEEMHFLDILAAADGPSADADIHNIRISHRDKKYARVTKLNLALYFETGDENLLPKVTMGDTIYIPEKNRTWLDKSKESTIRVLGAINKPGRYKFNDTMTLLDLLAEAGGTSPGAYLEKITVVNLTCCENQAKTFDLTEFSKTADFTMLPVLRAGDTVYIPREQDSTLAQARTLLKDIVEVASVAILFGGL
ncbi:sugar ABC transporter substrate-binding protein [Saccharobesus litoralis]|uniref:Sugar ABC transporter substrate-binding protein n=1 Tax=Saccharobesus litoralis TaxID=2172099 RepID=A0A2S0VMC2_9ALTE|nr:SLBB domain-containing protein [Saccharobesus litoralis]AWB65373.1 sugar ABC transporter substrate-binding protein [Saccharobesus litoralis]